MRKTIGEYGPLGDGPVRRNYGAYQIRYITSVNSLVFRSFETQVYTRFRSLRLSDNVTRANMPIPYDIFKKDSHCVPVWVEAAPDLETAQLRVVELDKQKPGDYMIFCYMTQELISAAPRTA